MKILEIIRLEESEQGTISVLKIDKQVFCFTLEPPDRENERNISSIPTGQYDIVPYCSKKYPEAYEILDVHGRSKVLLHSGNTVNHTAGCVLLGSSVGKLKGDRAVLNSGYTYAKFLRVMRGEQGHLTISECY